MICTDKPDFDKSEIKARDLRLIQQNNALALDVRCMNFDMPIVIDTFQRYAYLTGRPVEQLVPDKTLQDGYTIIDDDFFLILYNGNVPYSEHINWTLAHEVGHVYLGHTSDGGKQEIEANWFAAELLLPESIIRAIAVKRRVDFNDLQDIFGISITAAIKRINSLNRSSVWLSYREREIVQKYQAQINAYTHSEKYRDNITAAK